MVTVDVFLNDSVGVVESDDIRDECVKWMDF